MATSRWRLTVYSVNVRALFTINLDRYKRFVEKSSNLSMLEGFTVHNMTPCRQTGPTCQSNIYEGAIDELEL
jgi:hypothetical protein